ncbi:DUF2460 domain-containing protein [Myxosarcina sp. GI1(2024)]
MTYSGFELTFPRQPAETINFEFDTTIIEAQEGYESRQANRAEYRARFTFDTLSLTEAELTELQDFYDSVNGNLDTFKYKSRIEYTATKDFEEYYTGTDYDVHTRGRAYLRPDGTTYQLVKSYGVGGSAGDTSGYKTLKHIDLSTLEIYVDDTQVFDFTADGDMGVITFGTQPASGAVVSFSCEYYHEVRFDMENLEATLIAPGEYEVNSLALVEELTTTYSPLDANDYTEIPYSLKLPFEPALTRKRKFQVREKSLKNGRELRKLRNANEDVCFGLESNIITEAEKGLMLCWFIATKGRAVPFTYKAKSLRFDTDTFSLTTVRLEDDSDLYFNYNSFELLSTI